MTGPRGYSSAMTATHPSLTFLGELGEVLLQVGDALLLQVAVKLEPGDGLFFGEPSSGEQPTTADHLLQEPAAHCFQLSRVFPSDSVQEGFLELVQQLRGRAGQDSARPCAPSPQLQAPLPPRGLWDDLFDGCCLADLLKVKDRKCLQNMPLLCHFFQQAFLDQP